MKKINWKAIKKYIINATRFAIFTTVMLAGFWIVYLMLWNALGFPVNNTAMWLLFFQAIISETAFIKWFSEE